MKKNLSIAVLLSLSTLISGCSLEISSVSGGKRITPEKLADGSIVKVGYNPPRPEWKCIQIARETSGTLENATRKKKFELKDMLNPGTGNELEELKNQAIQFANKNRLQPSYIYLNIPSKKSVNDFNISPHSEGSAAYFTCKNPPAVNNSIF